MNVLKFTQIGKRENNEDFLGHNDNVFLVCDGVGGHAAGEVASRHVVDYIMKRTEDRDQEFTKTTIQELLTETQISLNNLLTENPEQVKMGTTFTGVFKSKHTWYAAHIGDSRIYFIRPSEEKIWHTWDHSLAGELMRTGEITREAGRHHPMGNRISRAIMANKKNKTVKADIVKLDNLKKGDLLFLCSDGVNEAWPEHKLMELLCNNNLNPKEKIQKIKTNCNTLSNDNNTACLIVIEKNEEISYGSNEEIIWLSLSDFQSDYQNYIEHKEKEALEDDNVVFVDADQTKSKSNKETKNNAGKNEIKKQKQSTNEINEKKKRYFIKEIIIAVLLIAASYLAYEMFIKKETTDTNKVPVNTIDDESSGNTIDSRTHSPENQLEVTPQTEPEQETEPKQETINNGQNIENISNSKMSTSENNN